MYNSVSKVFVILLQFWSTLPLAFRELINLSITLFFVGGFLNVLLNNHGNSNGSRGSR